MNETMKIITTNEAAGTATVEIDGKRRDLKASFQGDHVMVYGIAIRYPTGSKIWFGSFTYWPASGHINGIMTPMQHRARFAHVNVVGFYGDAAQAIRSQRPSR
jgi:hypothetical protein